MRMAVPAKNRREVGRKERRSLKTCAIYSTGKGYYSYCRGLKQRKKKFFLLSLFFLLHRLIEFYRTNLTTKNGNAPATAGLASILSSRFFNSQRVPPMSTEKGF